MLQDSQPPRKPSLAPLVGGLSHKPQRESYLESVTAASLKTPTNSGVAMLAEFAVKNDLRPALPKLTIPVLAAMTENNRSSAELIKSSVPGSQAEVFEDAGHCLFVDDADRFNTVLDNFIKKTRKYESVD